MFIRILFFLLPALVVAQEAVELRFAPVPNTPFSMHNRLESSLKREGAGELMQSVITSTRTLEWHPRTDGGWRLTSKPNDHTIEGQMEPLAKAVVQTLLSQEITYYINDNGELQEVVGFDSLQQDFENYADPSIPYAAVQAILNPEAQKWSARREYDERIGRFVGKTFTLNESWTSTEQADLPFAVEATLHRRSQISAVQNIGGVKLVTIDYAGATDLDKLVPLLNKAITDAGMGNKDSGQLDGLALIERGRLQVEAGTMRVIGQDSARIYRFPVNRNEGAQVVYERTDKRSVRFNYPAAE